MLLYFRSVLENESQHIFIKTILVCFPIINLAVNNYSDQYLDTQNCGKRGDVQGTDNRKNGKSQTFPIL